VVEAFAEREAPWYLIRDRDASYGNEFRHRVQSLGVKEVITAPRSPWQNAFAERLIGSIRHECLDHVVVLNERHLRRLLKKYLTSGLYRIAARRLPTPYSCQLHWVRQELSGAHQS
jgi:transposase InsO family protein